MSLTKDENWTIKIGLASCGIAAGARKVYEAFNTKLQDRGLNVKLKRKESQKKKLNPKNKSA